MRDIRPRPIIVEYNWYADRDMVWRARNSLKDTPFHLEEDQPAEVEARRYRMLPVYHKAMSLPAYKSRTFLNGDRLTVNGEHYNVDNLDRLPKELDPRLIATRTEGNTTIFFSINSPLSNHHPAKMTIDNKQFSCNEQYYFARRAELLGDESVQNKVMETDNPREMLRQGRRARNINNVKNVEALELAIMTRGVKEKFSQNKNLRDFLMATNQNAIGESTKASHYWGTGLALYDKKAFDRNLWKFNNLGEILMKQRDLFNN